MKDNKFIPCASTQDMLIKAQELERAGIPYEFVSNCMLKIIVD